jgi:CRISPR-associated protein Cas2
LSGFCSRSRIAGFRFHIQALLFARYLRGELDGYPPAIWK